MRIAIVGAGRVGTALGGALARAGHVVVYGVRDPADRTAEDATFAAVREAVAAADAVILATPWGAVEDALAACGDLGGRPLLDATNPFGPGPALPPGVSGGEHVQRRAPTARVVKVFDTTGAENLADAAAFGDDPRPLMVLCGDDPAAVELAAGLARDLGFEALPVGPLKNAGLVEGFARMWVEIAMVRKQGRNVAFALLRR